MPQVDKKKSITAASVGSESRQRQTKANSSREPIEIEKQKQKQSQEPPGIATAGAKTTTTTTTGDCVGGGPVETFVASSSSSTTSASASSCSSSPGSSSSTASSRSPSSVSPKPPPPQALTLIDANVESSGGRLNRQQTRSAGLSLAAVASDKSHQQERRGGSEQVERTRVCGGGALDKLASSDKAAIFQHQQQQQAEQLRREHEDELNNNSIHVAQQQQQQVKWQGESVKSSQTSLSPPIRQQQQTRDISPLSLLTGLRMHTNNLRSQQQQQQQQAQQQGGESYRRKPQLSNDFQIASTGGGAPTSSSQGISSSNKFSSPSLTSAVSPASFVESSLNPDEEEAAASEQQKQQQAPKQFSGYLIPSYTSIFNKPSTLKPTTGEQQKQQVSSISQLTSASTRLSESSTTTTTTTRQQVASGRSPLRKQAAHFDLSATTANTASSRSLFAPPSRPSAAATATAITNQPAKLPRLSDYYNSKSSRLSSRANTNDYEDGTSESSRAEGSNGQSSGDEEMNENLNHEEDDDDDELEREERNYQDDNDDDLDEDLDEKSPFSGRSQNQQPPESFTNVRSRATISTIRDSIRKSRNQLQQQQALESHHKQAHKYPGSAKSTVGRHLVKAPTTKQSAQSNKLSHKSIIMSSSSGSGKKLGQLPPPPPHTKISVSEISRPPSFNTTTNQANGTHCHNRQRDEITASCRKIDLLEQMAHLECSCHICAKNRKLASLHDNLYYHQHLHSAVSQGKLSNFDFNSSAKLNAIEKGVSGSGGGGGGYPKTRLVHMVLKSIILVLCTLLLLLVLVGSIMLTISLPHSMDKVVNATRSFNVTIAGRR